MTLATTTSSSTPTADHEVPVKLVQGPPEQPGPHCGPEIPASMLLGESVHYHTATASATVRQSATKLVDSGTSFQDSNGNDITVISSTDQPPMKTGEFTCRCLMTLAGIE